MLNIAKCNPTTQVAMGKPTNSALTRQSRAATSASDVTGLVGRAR
jgi:hypothetical protein